MLATIHKTVDRIILGITLPLMVLMLGCVVWQVVARYGLSISTSFSDELSRFLFIWISLLGAAYVLGKRGHIAITGLTDMAPPGARRGFELLSMSLVLVFTVAVLIFGGWLLVDKALRLGQISPAMQIPMGYVYLVIPFSGVLTVFYTLLLLAETLSGKVHSDSQVSLD